MRAAATLAAAAATIWLASVAPAGSQVAGAGVVRPEPASSSVAVAPAQAGPPLLAYAALGLAGLAAVLGGAALALGLDTRRRTDDLADAVRMRPTPAPDPRLAERLARLEAKIDDLAAAATAPLRALPPEATALSRDAFPPATRSASGRPSAGGAAPLSAAPPAVASAERLSAWLDDLKAHFARLALDPSSSVAGFVADHAPRGALAGPEGVALLDAFEGAKLWAVRAPVDGEVWALTPGEQAVLNWSAHFASQRTQVAAEVFGEAFDLVEGGAGLRLEEPALARRDAAGRLSVRRRGRLSGFRG